MVEAPAPFRVAESTTIPALVDTLVDMVDILAAKTLPTDLGRRGDEMTRWIARRGGDQEYLGLITYGTLWQP